MRVRVRVRVRVRQEFAMPIQYANESQSKSDAIRTAQASLSSTTERGGRPRRVQAPQSRVMLKT